MSRYQSNSAYRLETRFFFNHGCLTLAQPIEREALGEQATRRECGGPAERLRRVSENIAPGASGHPKARVRWWSQRDRTDDLKLASIPLSQLSYGPYSGRSTIPSIQEEWWAWEDLNFRPTLIKRAL